MDITFKKIAALLLVLCLMFTIISCNNTPQDNDPPSTNDNNETNNNNNNNTENDNNEINLGTFAPPTGPIKNVIFIIGDGMGMNHIKAGELDRGSKYAFQSWQHASINTDSVDADTGEFVVTDSSASATALATGTLTNNKLVGIDPNGNTLATIMDYAKACGKSTGIVTTDYLYGATPAGFSAHANSRTDNKTITETQLGSGVNFLAGLTSAVYGQTLYKNIISNSPYYFTDSLDDSQIAHKDNVMLALDLENGEEGSVSLSNVTKSALDYLEEDSDGFVLMIEQAYIDKCSHDNKFGDMINRMHSLGETVDAIMEWIGDRNDTVVLISADHETGGLKVSADEELRYTYNGQNGSFNFSWGGKDHTRSYVSLYVYGTNEKFNEYATFVESDTAENLIKNTDIFTLMKRLVTTGE